MDGSTIFIIIIVAVLVIGIITANVGRKKNKNEEEN